MKKYDHKKIEKHWRETWEKEKLYETPDEVKGKENFYQLVEFPYPSGNLHVGHWYAFSVPDIFVRAKRMQGRNVLYPVGFDAFGLPAENAAIKHGLNPRKWTEQNIEKMKEQIRSMGASFDWSREVVTADPEYYKWTQWLFLKFYERGLAYQQETSVNWCPSCKTVLANEQVHQGECERCGTEVEQKQMKQWMLKITEYAERLLKDLEELDWPDEIKESQRNWIGKSTGARVNFPINKKYNYVLLHGYTGRPTKNFFPWLKNKLDELGLENTVLALPDPDSPTVMEQAEFVLKKAKFDENTILMGHSLGGAVALKTAEQLSEKIAGLVLIGAPINDKLKDKKKRDIEFDWNYDFAAAKEHAGFVKILSDPDDYAVPLSHGQVLQEELGGQLYEINGTKPHFTGSKEPEILNALLPSIEVFTTRPDTTFGATYLVLAPEHSSIKNLELRIKNKEEVKSYVHKALKKTERQRQEEAKEKTGVELKGVKAINPATDEEIPVWVADYVLGSVGTGAIMAVPAHDERDFEFAKKYELPYRKVIEPPEVVDEPVQPPSAGAWGHLDADVEATVWTGDGKLAASGEFTGQKSHEARTEMAKKFGGVSTQYRMRDWVISRQRYWGCPIPVIHCEMCEKAYPVPEENLPVELPELKDFKPKGDGKGPLARAEEWVKVKCSECGLPAERETDTMDTFVDSSWYFLRYTDPENKKKFASKERMKKWMPVDRYSGGAEHTTMHLLYSRFWIKAMHDLELLEWNEPYTVRMNRGIILGPDGQKMSKSKDNVVDPDEYVEKLGADTVRMYLGFIGPYNEVGAYPWDPEGIMGVRRFLEKVWKMYSEIGGRRSENGDDTAKLLHRTIKKVTEDVEAFKFNTAIAQLMSFVNKAKELDEESGEVFLRLLAPFAPHMSEEIWREVLGNKKSIHLGKWPEYDEKFLKEEEVEIPVQIDSKVRTILRVNSDTTEDEIKSLALEDEKVKKYLQNKEIKRTTYVKGKIINFDT